MGATVEGVLEHAVEFLETLRMLPGAVVIVPLKGVEQTTGTKLWGVGDHQSVIVILSHAELDEAIGQGVEEVKICCASGRKVTHIRVIGSFAERHIVDELRNDKIQVHIALAMAVCGEIHWHTIDARRKIGAMVQVKAAQEILIGFACAAVLRDCYTRDNLQHFARPE